MGWSLSVSSWTVPLGVLGLAARELDVALLRRLCDDLLPLFERQRLLEPVTVGGAHVVHADGRDGLHARVDLGRADDEAAAAANPDRADPLLVDERLRAQEVHRGAEVLGVDVRRDGVAGLALALAPEGQVQGQGDEALLGHLRGVEVRRSAPSPRPSGARRRWRDSCASRFRPLGMKRFPATLIWYWFLKVTFCTVTLSLL